MAVLIRYGIFALAVVLVAVQYNLMKKRDFPETSSQLDRIYLRAFPAAVFFMVLYLFFFCRQGTDILMPWKRICLFSILWMVAYTDAKTHLIWNEHILMGVGFYGILFLVGLAADPANVVFRLISDLIGSTVLLVFGFVLRLISRKGMGMGDIKLFTLLPLFLGTIDALYAVFFAMLVLFVQACFCLVTGKKSRKDALPFGPGIFIGACLVIFSSGI